MQSTSSRQGVLMPFVISLVGGLIITIFSLINLVWFGSGAPSWRGFGDYMGNLMGGYHNFLGNYASSTGFFTSVSIASFVCGIIVMMSALVLWMHPEDHTLWGGVIVVFSVVSFVGMGGYFVGAIFGIVGGIIALRYKPLIAA